MNVVPRTHFDDGLRFECTQCGKCCTGEPGLIRVSGEEIRNLAGLLEITPATFARDYLKPDRPDDEASIREHADGSCVFFAHGKCSVYSARPAQCRTYPFWLKNLRSPEAWQRVARECPGIGHGPLFSRDQILDIVRESPV